MWFCQGPHLRICDLPPQVASDVLTGGRSARLIKQLVLRGSCLSASVLVGYPGDLHPGLSLVTAVPKPGGRAFQQQHVMSST
jgi:hypothetical protein